MKKNTKWLLENKINYERIFENKGEKKLDFVIESLIENRNLLAEIIKNNFAFSTFSENDIKLSDIYFDKNKIVEMIKKMKNLYLW